MEHKAFLSSTFEDLKDHRRHAIAALRRAGFFVDPMEDWPASPDEPKKFSRERIEGCDLCVLLIGFRRGHVPRGEQLSITQLEYRHALSHNIDVLVFLLDEDTPWKRKFDELDKDPEVRRWRNELKEQRGIGFFGLDPTSIELAPALSRWIAKKHGKKTNRVIDVVNRTRGQLSDEDLIRGTRAVSRQIAGDFAAYWEIDGNVRLVGDRRYSRRRSQSDASDDTGDGVVYVYRDTGIENARALHERGWRGIPWGIVILNVSMKMGESWSTSLSREVLRLLSDPDATGVVVGPHPIYSSRQVRHWREVCDPVLADEYDLDRIMVSNFVLPSYYSQHEVTNRHDFLGRTYQKKRLKPFGVNPGGYLHFFDPKKGKNLSFMRAGDAAAEQRLRIQAVINRAFRGHKRAELDLIFPGIEVPS